MQLSSANVLGESSGSRRLHGSGSRNAFGGADLNYRRATEDINRKAIINSSGQRISQSGSLDPRRVTSSRNSSHVKNYETALKGMEGLKLKNVDSHQ